LTFLSVARAAAPILLATAALAAGPPPADEPAFDIRTFYSDERAFATPLAPTRDYFFRRMQEQELKNDVKCWSTAKHIDEIFSGVRATGPASHGKEKLVEMFVRQLWFNAQNLNAGKMLLEKADLEKAFVIFGWYMKEVPGKDLTLVYTKGRREKPPLEFRKIDLDDYRRTSAGWRATYSAASESSPKHLHVNLSTAAADYLADAADVFALSLLSLAAEETKARGLAEATPEILMKALGDIPLGIHTDGWASGADYVPRAYAQALAYAHLKIQNLGRINGVLSSEAAIAQEASFAGVKMSTETSSYLHEILRELAIRVWSAAQLRTKSAEVLVGGADLFAAIEEIIPYKLDDLSRIHFFPLSAKPIVYQEYESDTFRDDAYHWVAISEILRTRGINGAAEPARVLKPLDVFAAEELSEIISNYAVPLLREAGGYAKAERRGELSRRDLERAHALFKDHQRLFPSRPKLPAKEAKPAESWRGPTPMFQNVTAESGIAPIEDASILHDPAMAGASLMAFDAFRGVAVGDFNDDGKPDLFVAEERGRSRLYRNAGAGKFVDVTPAAIAGLDVITGGAFFDYDNDGCKDLFVLRVYASSRLLKGDCRGAFSDETEKSGLSEASYPATGITIFDYDNDGRLDLYIRTTGDFKNGFLPAMGDVETAMPNHLFRNAGGTFTEVTDEAGAGDRRIALAAAVSDFANRGAQDVYIANDMQPNTLYRNDGGKFVNVAVSARVDDYGNGMGVSVGDFNHDGLMDIYLTNINTWNPRNRYIRPVASTMIDSSHAKDPFVRTLQANRLYQNLGGFKFKDVTDRFIGPVATGFGWNGYFFDADNDGYLDLYISNGFRPESLKNHDEKKVFLRWDESRKRFTDLSADSALDYRSNSRGGAFADFDGDGFPDLILTGLHSPVLFKSGLAKTGNHWLAIRLIGTVSNRDGFGARVMVKTGKLRQTLEMGNQGGGFISNINDDLHVGLGKASAADRIEVTWPSGLKQVLENVAADRRVTVTEGR